MPHHLPRLFGDDMRYKRYLGKLVSLLLVLFMQIFMATRSGFAATLKCTVALLQFHRERSILFVFLTIRVCSVREFNHKTLMTLARYTARKAQIPAFDVGSVSYLWRPYPHISCVSVQKRQVSYSMLFLGTPGAVTKTWSLRSVRVDTRTHFFLVGVVI